MGFLLLPVNFCVICFKGAKDEGLPYLLQSRYIQRGKCPARNLKAQSAQAFTPLIGPIAPLAQRFAALQPVRLTPHP